MLSWAEAGDPRGPVVVYFHGTPGSKDEIPHPDVVVGAGVRLLTLDRPGYGASPPAPHTSLLDIGRGVLRDLDERGVYGFAVLGWSGGGPHALACAALAPGRVHTVGLLSSWAPMNPPDPGLPSGVRLAMRVGAGLPRGALRSMLLLSGRTSVGMVDDVRRVARPWHFGVSDIASRVRVRAWHAEADREVPIAPWRDAVGVQLSVIPGSEHDVSRDVWASALRECTFANEA